LGRCASPSAPAATAWPRTGYSPGRSWLAALIYKYLAAICAFVDVFGQVRHRHQPTPCTHMDPVLI